MSVVIQPRHGPNGTRHVPPDAGGNTRFWVGMSIVALLLLSLGISDFWPKRARGTDRKPATCVAAAVASPELPPPPVTTAPVPNPPAEQPRPADPEAPMRDLQAQASVINAIEIEYMKTAMRYNESLPPEDRRPQAPTADTIRKMQEERLILQ